MHLDYAGPISGKMFLVIIDAHSKWLDVKMVNSATSNSTIEHLCSVFSVHGLFEAILTDNGTVFTSSEFQDFMKVMENITFEQHRIIRLPKENCEDS